MLGCELLVAPGRKVVSRQPIAISQTVACTESTDITATTDAALPSNPVVSQPMTAVDSKASATQTVTGKGVTCKTVARKAAAVKGPESSAGSSTSSAVEAPATSAVETPATSAVETPAAASATSTKR